VVVALNRLFDYFVSLRLVENAIARPLSGISYLGRENISICDELQVRNVPKHGFEL
jgi:hypothetical protein